MKHIRIDLRWRLAKLAAKVIRWWAQQQYDIDGDYVQVGEILSEWFAVELKEEVAK